MGKSDKYFLFNKEQDYKRCFLHNMDIHEGGLLASAKKNNQDSVLISRILDSKEEDMEWHLLTLELSNKGYISFKLSIYASNSMELACNGEGLRRIDETAMDSEMSIGEKERFFAPCLKKEAYSTEDILLHEVKGRYLWFILKADFKRGHRFYIKRIRVSFPGRSWISYLPEVYGTEGENGFLKRFLAVFQTLYEELNLEIEKVPYLIDVESAGSFFLNRLAEWMGIGNAYMWSEEQLRVLLKNALKWYRIRGTREAVKIFARLYVNNGMVYVVENFELMNYRNKEELERLYGNDPFGFSVIVREDELLSMGQYRTLMKIIEEAAPAHMQPNLIVLKPYIFLSRHSYMGINSVLGEYREMSLNGSVRLEFSTLGKE